MRRGQIIVLLILGHFLTPVAAFGQSASLVRLSYSSGWDALPAIVANERGFFAQEGLVVSGMPITSAQSIMTSLVGGSTDIAAVPQRTLIVMAAAGIPVKVIGMNGWGTQHDLVAPAADETINSVTDLKGKRVAVGLGSESFPELVRLLNANGLRPSDVEIKELGGEQLLSTFKNDIADAVFEARHYTSTMVAAAGARVVLSDKDIREALGSIRAKPLVAGEIFLKNEAPTAQKFMNAWTKALIYIQQEPADAARLLQIFFHRQGTTVSNELAQSWVSYTRYDRYKWTEDDVLDTEYNGWGLKEAGVLKIKPELDQLIENSFAEKALARLQQ